MANALNRMRALMEEQSKSPSSDKSKTAQATRGRKDTLPKKGVMPQGKRWNRTRFTEKEEVPTSFYSHNLPTCSRSEIVKKVDHCWLTVLRSIEKVKGTRSSST